jgi:hypothetical protein
MTSRWKKNVDSAAMKVNLAISVVGQRTSRIDDDEMASNSLKQADAARRLVWRNKESYVDIQRATWFRPEAECDCTTESILASLCLKRSRKFLRDFRSVFGMATVLRHVAPSRSRNSSWTPAKGLIASAAAPFVDDSVQSCWLRDMRH